MPLINGQKMACEPCIRGHRSTKCTHANERLMVPVRKPGRPLSSCPHPSSRPCACSAVTAAIPKKQKCRCGTSEPAPAENDDKKAPAADITPLSPSKAANPSFRVQKQASRSRPATRQSIDLSGLERMDANQLNILPVYDGAQRAIPMPNGQAAAMQNVAMYGALGLTPTDNYPMFPYPAQSSMAASALGNPAINGHGAPSTNASTTSSAAPTPGGCCGGGANGIKAETATKEVPSAASMVDGVGEKKAKSCCSTASDSHETKPLTDSMPAPNVSQQPNGILMSPFQPPMALPHGMYPYFSHPTIFNYPPQLGSFLQPLQPEQWRHLMSAMNYGQPVGVPPNPYGMAGPAAFQPPSTPNGTPWTSHQCTCGDSCQCIGCAAHPYNEATQNYVRSAWNTMAEESAKVHGRTNSHASHVHGNGSSHERSASRASTGATTPVTAQAEGTISPLAPQTPSDGVSGASEEQTLSANDFFFVSYPFGDACAGDTASCPCGDDCACIGCVIHNNPGPEETTEDSSL